MGFSCGSVPPVKTNYCGQFAAKKLAYRLPKLIKKSQSAQQCKTKSTSFDKQLQVLKYMGKSAPKSFQCNPENIVICGVLPSLYTTSSEEEVRKEIADVISAEGGEYKECTSDDFEFIRVSRRNAVVPTVKPGFEWDGSAVKRIVKTRSCVC